MAAWLALAVLIISGFLLVGRHDALMIGGLDAADIAMAVSGALLAVWLAAGLPAQMHENHPRAMRRLARAGVVLAVLALAVLACTPVGAGARALAAAWVGGLPLPAGIAQSTGSWWRSVVRANPADVAGGRASVGERAVRFRCQPNGQFHATATLNGTPARLLVDSGATAIVLRAEDARGAGIDMDRLSFTTPLATAQGTAYVARVRLRRVTVGILAFDDVEAFVAEPGHLNSSLLGMSFLSRLRSYDSTDGFLTLRG